MKPKPYGGLRLAAPAYWKPKRLGTGAAAPQRGCLFHRDRRTDKLTTYQDVKARVSLKEYAEQNLEKLGRAYICPACESGTGSNKTPAFSIAKNGSGDNWKCFACGKGGDIFDLAAIVRNIDPKNKRAQLEEVARFGNIIIDQPRQEQPQRKKQPQMDTVTEDSRARERAFIAAAQARLAESSEATAYLAERGISLEQAKAWGFGYDNGAQRIVIPWKGCDYYHADRDITGKAKAKYRYPKTEDVGERPLYNAAALDNEIVFVVEGALDALAVEGSGYEAVALGSNRNRLLAEQAGTKNGSRVFVLMLDNDHAGNEGAEDTAAQLEALGFPSIRKTIDGHKDTAEAWQHDRAKLRAALEAAAQEAAAELEARREREYASTLEGLRAYNPLDVVMGLYDVDSLLDPIGTGIGGLDEMLGGGLPRGLIVLGAVSSVGKTTFSLQVADTMAASGTPVLFATIEQSAQEIAAKSLSRIMRERFTALPGSGYSATAQEITSKQRRKAWSEAQNAAFLDACEVYTNTVSKNLVIYEGRKQPTVEDVKRVAWTMAGRFGKQPVVFIDYLQLLSPEDAKDGTKEAIDHIVTALRQLSRELQTPVFVISSLNRSSYGKGVTLDSFKESGAIEYGADVLLGLQPAGMMERLDGITDEKKAKKEADRTLRDSKAKAIRDCELIVLKQRNGRLSNEPLRMTFYAPSGLFVEAADPQEQGRQGITL